MAYALCMGDPAKAWFGMFTGYFDDTGDVDTHGVGAFGLLAHVDQWVRFETEWARVRAMPEFDLDYLHMKELNSGKGKFAKFKDNAGLQEQLLDRLCGLIRVRVEKYSPGCFIPNKTYESMNSFYRLQETVGRSSLAGIVSISLSRLWLDANYPGQKVKFVFDQGYKGWGRLVSFAKKNFGDVPVQADEKKETPLQASDFVAWEAHRAVKALLDKQSGLKGHIRPSFKKLLATLGGNDWLTVDELQLFDFCQRVGIPRRV